jgi:hypothetical protein
VVLVRHAVCKGTEGQEDDDAANDYPYLSHRSLGSGVYGRPVSADVIEYA